MFLVQSGPFLDRWSVIITLASDLFLFGSLIFVGLQVAEQREQAKDDRKFRRQELRVQSNASLQPFFLMLFQNPDLAEVWEVGRKDHLLLNETQMTQLKWASVHWFEHIAGIYSLAKLDLIEKKDLEGWERSLKDDFLHDKKPGLVHWWCQLEEDYEAEFRQWVHDLVGFDLVCHCQECGAKNALY